MIGAWAPIYRAHTISLITSLWPLHDFPHHLDAVQAHMIEE